MKKETNNNQAALFNKVKEMKEKTEVTFREYAEIWLALYKAPPKLRETSYTTIKYTLKTQVMPVLGDMVLRDISPMDIQLFLNAISDMSRSVQAKSLMYVKSIFNTAVDNGLIEKSPVSSTDKPLGEKKKDEDPLTDDQVVALLKAVEGTNAYLFVLIALSTGMRRGEILGLMWEDIDFNTGYINVTHNKAFTQTANDAPVTTALKTDSARRRIPISPFLRKKLLEEKAITKSDFVMHTEDNRSMTRGSYRAMWRIVDTRCVGQREMGQRIAGAHTPGSSCVCLDFKTHPHQLRHTFCTKCIESGMGIKEVQYLMGHASPDITLKIYTHYRQSMMESETAERMCGAVSYIC